MKAWRDAETIRGLALLKELKATEGAVKAFTKKELRDLTRPLWENTTFNSNENRPRRGGLDVVHQACE